MSGTRWGFDRKREGDPDQRLSALMQQWPAVGAGDGFDEAVWRRIRSVPGIQPVELWNSWLGFFMPHPIYAGAAATAVALLIGILVGLHTPGDARGGIGSHALLHPRTLMGTFAVLAERGHP